MDFHPPVIALNRSFYHHLYGIGAGIVFVLSNPNESHLVNTIDIRVRHAKTNYGIDISKSSDTQKWESFSNPSSIRIEQYKNIAWSFHHIPPYFASF